MTRRITIMLLAALVCCGVAAAAEEAQGESKRESTLDDYGCRIERYSVYSPSMDKHVKVAVVLPPGYDKNKQARYPVIYTLHGARAPYDTYANMPRLRSTLAEMPMIYTCFEAELSSYLDWPENPKMQFTTFFFDEFIPHVETTYRTNGQRGVTGFSMGGSGAMHYTLTKPEMFVATCSMSTGFRRYSAPSADSNNSRRYRYGDYETHKDFYTSIDSYKQIAKQFKAGAALPAIMLRCGTEDRSVKGLRSFRDLLIELNQAKRKEIAARSEGEAGSKKASAIDKIMETEGVNFVHVESPGRHAWPYWHGQAKEVARFFWESFGNDAKSKAAAKAAKVE